jgi:DNA processing protein
MPKEDDLNVAIVGARQCSQYGSYVATELAKELADAKITLISGMARGIDGISQEAAVQKNGSVYAVLGSGVDVCYPRSNAGLYEKLCISPDCGVLSEYAPGTAARAALFPPRNRIISGLSDVIVVVEACLKSGTLITVDMALEQGKEVYAVPGRVTDRLSDGCNKLIREGATPFWSPAEFIREIQEKKDSLLLRRQPDESKSRMGQDFMGNKPKTTVNCGDRTYADFLSEPKPSVGLTETEKSVYAQCDLFPKSADSILASLPQMNMPEVLCTLTMLELKGCITRVGGEYQKSI